MISKGTLLYLDRVASKSTSHKGILRDGGYGVVSATSGPQALLLVASRALQAVVIDDGALRDDSSIASGIRRSSPRLPIVIMTNHARIPASSLRAVDALVAKADPPEFLLATLHFILNVQPPDDGSRRARKGKP